MNPDTETFTSFETAYRYAYGRELSDRLYTLQAPEDRIKFTIDFIKDYSGLDCTEYLRTLASV